MISTAVADRVVDAIPGREDPQAVLFAAEGTLFEAVAVSGCITGAADEVAAVMGLALSMLDACLASLCAARWITVRRDSGGRLTVRLAV
jgi:hypothetical protein